VAEFDLLAAQVDGGFIAAVAEAEGIVLFDFPCGLGVERLSASWLTFRTRTPEISRSLSRASVINS
jgi:hypothetical protein